MLKYQTWYAIVWTSVLALYALGLSSFNEPLYLPLFVFFAVTIVFSVSSSRLTRCVPLLKVTYVQDHKPIVTALLCLGFIADWAYQGALPILRSYTGFITGTSETVVVGIPIFHVVLIDCSIYWGMYLGYLFVCNPERKRYLAEFGVMIGLFIINLSRGYIVFIFFVMFLCYASFHIRVIHKTIRKNVPAILALILGILLLIFFISIMGNMRYGYAWNDCTYIERIGHFVNYPEWLSKHFMWFYSYVTSPLANLNLNAAAGIDHFDVGNYLISFLPAVFSNTNPLTTPTLLVATYFNAATGFVSFVRSGGMVGIYICYAVIYVYYWIVRHFLQKSKGLETFGNAVLCLLVCSMIFFNSLRTSALCYLPILLILHSIYISREIFAGKVAVLAATEPAKGEFMFIGK